MLIAGLGWELDTVTDVQGLQTHVCLGLLAVKLSHVHQA